MSLVWAGLATALGVLVVRLPIEYSLALLISAALSLISIWEPALGLGLAMTLGPAKAFLGVAYPALPLDPGQIFFALALAGWLARGLLRRAILLPRIWLLMPLGLYLAIGLFSLLPATSLEESLKEVLKWAEIAVSLVILVSEAERGRWRWIVAGLLIAGVAQSLVGIWQYQFRESGPEHFRILGNHFRAYGSFEQPNPYGGFLGLIWPVAAGLALGHLTPHPRPLPPLPTASRLLAGQGGRGGEAGVRGEEQAPHQTLANLTKSFFYHQPFRISFPLPSLAYSAAAVLCLIGLYVSFSRGAWLGAAAAALAMIIALPRRLMVGLGLVMTALGGGWALNQAGLLPASITSRLVDIANFTAITDVRGVLITDVNFSIVERLAHWQAAVRMAEAHPWLGVGMGNYEAAYSAYHLLNWPNALGHAHMIYLNVLAETGVIGLIAYLGLWIAIFGLTLQVIGRAHGVTRGLALGLLRAWAHFSAHQVFDNLYVNNIHFTLGALLALLVCAARTARSIRPTTL